MNTVIPRSIIDMLSENIYWLGKDGYILGCNKNQALVFGYDSPADLEGKTLFDVAEKLGWPKSVAEAVQANNLQIMQMRKSAVFEEKGFWGGKDHYMLSYKHPWIGENQEVLGIVGISIDITDRKDFEIALEKAKNKAEAASKAKSEFLGNLSHDLRTPLSSLVALSQYIATETHNQAIHSFALDAQACAEQVMFLIDEILEITEIDAGHISNKVPVCRLQELLQSIQQLMLPAAQQKQLKLLMDFDVSIPEFVVTNCHLIHRILMNLVSNAIKFTHKGEIKVAAQLAHQNADKIAIKLTVQDTGIGIAKADQKRIFNQFERLTSAYEGRYQGRGLGLYIVNQFAKVLSAKIEIDSEVDKGTLIALEFEVSKAEKSDQLYKPLNFSAKPEVMGANKVPQSQIEQSSVCESAKAKILLIEDTPMAQVVAKIAFKPFASKIDVAETGVAGIALSKMQTYDLILLDIGLPDMFGLDVAKKIRQLEQQRKLPPVPIIALTAHLGFDVYHEAYAAGIQQIVRKPISLAQADIILKNWLSESSTIKTIIEKAERKPKKAIDLNACEKVMGDRTLAKEMLAEFIKALPYDAKKIKEAFEANDRQKLKDSVHYLNGSSSYAGAPLLKQACNSLEAGINDQFSDEEITALFEDVCAEVDRVLQAYAGQKN